MEYWEGRPSKFVTIGGHDCDHDGIHAGMDACPNCAEDYIGECESDGCPSKLKLEGNVSPGLQLSLGGLYSYPLANAITEAGLALYHSRIGFNLTVGFVHNFTDTQLGMALQSRFLFPDLTRDFVPLEWYIGASAITINTFYLGGDKKPSRLYLGRTGIDWVLIDLENHRLALDFGGYLGAYQRTVSFITGARKETQEETTVTGGALLFLHYDIR